MSAARTTPRQAALAERVRALLPGAATREVSMFGSLAFMVDGRMHVAVGKEGDLLVHIDPDRYEALLAAVGARPAVMGAGRPMGRGWIEVAGAALEGDALARWLQEPRELSRHADGGPGGR